ncbi:MAG TPA: DUF488 domain-containing protein [Burkholderiales bacterium]|nr:DUF488 domain-containing protein [Burkholderiales bacterium]
MKAVRVKRAYAPASVNDGLRVLVDRVWPRGITREKLKADLWVKEIAPSTALRKWFGHDPEKWPEFKKRYFRELDGRAEAVEGLRKAGAKHSMTLLFAARDEEHNNAVALAEYLRKR